MKLSLEGCGNERNRERKHGLCVLILVRSGTVSEPVDCRSPVYGEMVKRLTKGEEAA
jgi:hypothetical protein